MYPQPSSLYLTVVYCFLVNVIGVLMDLHSSNSALLELVKGYVSVHRGLTTENKMRRPSLKYSECLLKERHRQMVLYGEDSIGEGAS